MNEQNEIYRIACENALYMQTEASKVNYSTACDEANHKGRPSTKYQPKLSIDGDMWCALYGDNIQDGVAGFGKSPEKAFEDFDRAWRCDLPQLSIKKGSLK